MELWIRSQNKCELREAGVIKYEYEYEKHTIECNGYTFATYESKERCIEIIDEIQELLKLGNTENAFYNITNCKMPFDELSELFKRDRKDNAIVTRDVDFEVIMPSVVTYEMPEK